MDEPDQIEDHSSEFMDRFNELYDEDLEWEDGEWEQYAHEAGSYLRSSEDRRDFDVVFDFTMVNGDTSWLVYLTLNTHLTFNDRVELLEMVDWAAHNAELSKERLFLAEILDGYDAIHDPALMAIFDAVVSRMSQPDEDIEKVHSRVMAEWATAKPKLLSDLISDYEGAKRSGHWRVAAKVLKQIERFVDNEGLKLVINNRRKNKLPAEWLARVLCG